AKQRGARIFTETNVEKINLKDGHVHEVVTDKGSIKTEVVVNATGQWGGGVGKMVGLNLPVVPMAHLYAITKPFEGVRHDFPTLRDPDLLVYWREEVGELRLLDWEYAGMGDIFFDLANFSHHHRLTDDQVRLLLQEYFGEVTPGNFARLKLMWPMSELHEAMWGTTQTGISKLKEDFQGYADLWFGRLRQHVTDYRWEQWLKDVSQKSK
ncbi:MAG: FAD-dependent oxidoreductase, partial [Anaerolineales bacterium]|nr:FAD-dependent oxidoreductase [Anaerolineales bacterium]